MSRYLDADQRRSWHQVTRHGEARFERLFGGDEFGVGGCTGVVFPATRKLAAEWSIFNEFSGDALERGKARSTQTAKATAEAACRRSFANWYGGD